MSDCNCNSRDLFNFGCRCKSQADGQFHLWENGVDIVVARDIDEARKIVIETVGYTDEEAEGQFGWSIISSDRKITINEDEDVYTTLTAEKWVKEIGKPEYLGSSEY
jgi:hypothetical protein